MPLSYERIIGRMIARPVAGAGLLNACMEREDCSCDLGAPDLRCTCEDAGHAAAQ